MGNHKPEEYLGVEWTDSVCYITILHIIYKTIPLRVQYLWFLAIFGRIIRDREALTILVTSYLLYRQALFFKFVMSFIS